MSLGGVSLIAPAITHTSRFFQSPNLASVKFYLPTSCFPSSHCFLTTLLSFAGCIFILMREFRHLNYYCFDKGFATGSLLSFTQLLCRFPTGY